MSAYHPMQLAEMFIKTGELADALEALDQQLAEHPDDDSARRLRASVLLRVQPDGGFQRALADMQALREITADDEVQLAIIYEQIGDLSNATQATERALTLSPDEPRICERLFRLYRLQGEQIKALQFVRQLPRKWYWLQHEADLLVEIGDDFSAAARYATVMDNLRKHFQIPQDRHIAAIYARVAIARGHALRRLENYSEALRAYAEAEKIIADDPTIPFNRGLTYALQGELETAITLCQTAFNAVTSDIVRTVMREDATKIPALATQLHLT